MARTILVLPNAHRRSIGRPPVREDADVGGATAQVPAHDVAGPVVRGVPGQGQGLPMPAEEGHQVRHPPVVDVRVRSGKAPIGRVRAEVALHVLVDPLLQVDPQLPVGPHHHIGADPFAGRHIAVGVVEREVRGVVLDVLQGEREGGIGERAVEAGLPEEGSRGEKQEGQEERSSCHICTSNGLV